MNFGSLYVQDKWRIDRLTLNLGVRYEVEAVRVPEPVEFNPRFDSPDAYPVDWNNVSPRLGFAYQLDDQGHTAIRGGFGKYYLRTEFGWTSQYYKDGPFTESFVVDFPIDGLDPGPSDAEFPTHPTLATFPAVNHAWIEENFPPGSRQLNVGSACTDPRPTGKVEVYLTPRDVPGALSFTEGTLDLSSPTGVFTGIRGVVAAHFAIPDGYTFDGDVTIRTPLSETLLPARSVRVDPDGRTLVAEFNKADLDNNVPEGASVPLILTANFIQNGVQRELMSSANVTVVK
jgi:hypothetical protein